MKDVTIYGDYIQLDQFLKKWITFPPAVKPVLFWKATSSP